MANVGEGESYDQIFATLVERGYSSLLNTPCSKASMEEVDLAVKMIGEITGREVDTERSRAFFYDLLSLARAYSEDYAGVAFEVLESVEHWATPDLKNGVLRRKEK